MRMSIPHCCDEPLEVWMTVPGYEYRCPVCKKLYEFFDGFKRIAPADMTAKQLMIAVERGWELGNGEEK